ncbi:hypothetical protein CQ035_11835 [Brevundimonas sp. MYb46]|nr:hypothetical protein CQ026_08685 [Brevundimonas sp. MYb31]PRA33569.1 hypothetical protein CQ024_04210 [Brevundimonas sp. MYb27]PRB13364.1 hypothetical protein CQ039_12820 [Brevundimonas sp. MYb52]PRB34013.1 hypothetical protein CQ035_11835 [Brevundimonas sp. MYb46]PRB52701.1 hypothetical protein CQ028_05940 [Brevundimonas sp. MYb33]
MTQAPYLGDKAAGQIMMLGVGSICVGVLLLLFVVGIAFIGLGIAWIVQSRKLRARWTRESGVVADGCLYAAADIVELVATHPDAGACGRTGTAVVDLRNAQAAFSYQASVRLRSDSRAIVLVGGLTHQTAIALIRDMAAVLFVAREA